jgi:hypothetical protein
MLFMDLGVENPGFDKNGWTPFLNSRRLARRASYRK